MRVGLILWADPRPRLRELVRRVEKVSCPSRSEVSGILSTRIDVCFFPSAFPFALGAGCASTGRVGASSRVRSCDEVVPMDVALVVGVDVDNDAGLATSAAGDARRIVVNDAAGLSLRILVIIGDIVTREGVLMLGNGDGTAGLSSRVLAIIGGIGVIGGALLVDNGDDTAGLLS